MNHNLETETLTDSDRTRIRSLANAEIQFVLELMAEDDPDRYQDVADGLRKIAWRYDGLRNA